VPGSVAGRIELIQKYGRLPLKNVVAPAIRLAKEGFKLDASFAGRLRSDADFFTENSEIAKVFYRNGQPDSVGRYSNNQP
jgi:gamma-glutamyltranspeptidase/glutathione hydrolase